MIITRGSTYILMLRDEMAFMDEKGKSLISQSVLCNWFKPRICAKDYLTLSIVLMAFTNVGNFILC